MIHNIIEDDRIYLKVLMDIVNKMKKLTVLLISLSSLAWSAGSMAASYDYDFTCGDYNNSKRVENCAQGEEYLGLKVEETGSGVSFTLTNSGDLVSNLTRIWFDDDNVLLDISTADIIESSGVDFKNVVPSSQDVSNLEDFVAEAKVYNKGGAKNNPVSGITSGHGLDEWLTINFDFTTGNTFDLLVAALETGTFKLGVRVDSFLYNDKSTKFYAPSAVPVPAAAWLFGSALLGFIGFSRRTSV